VASIQAASPSKEKSELTFHSAETVSQLCGGLREATQPDHQRDVRWPRWRWIRPIAATRGRRCSGARRVGCRATSAVPRISPARRPTHPGRYRQSMGHANRCAVVVGAFWCESCSPSPAHRGVPAQSPVPARHQAVIPKVPPYDRVANTVQQRETANLDGRHVDVAAVGQQGAEPRPRPRNLSEPCRILTVYTRQGTDILCG
jgi:hypothetical protein